MRIHNQLVLIGFSILTSTAAADQGPKALGPAAGSSGDLLTPDGVNGADGAPGEAVVQPPTKDPGQLAKRRALIDAAMASDAPLVKEHLAKGIEKAGGADRLVATMPAQWYTQLQAKLSAAKLSSTARQRNPSLGEPVATAAGTCDGDCDKDKDKNRPLSTGQQKPIEDLTQRLPPPPPPAPPAPPFVPAPQPALPGINNDMILGGVFGLIGGVLLGSLLSNRQNQHRPNFPYRGMPMRPGGFPLGYRGGFGGRLGPPAIAGAASVGGGLGAPAVLPPIYSAPQYSVYGGTNAGINSVSMFGNTPLTTSPIMNGALGNTGAPSVIRPY